MNNNNNKKLVHWLRQVALGDLIIQGFHLSILWPQRTASNPFLCLQVPMALSHQPELTVHPVCSMYGQGQMGGMRGEGTEEEQDAVALSSSPSSGV